MVCQRLRATCFPRAGAKPVGMSQQAGRALSYSAIVAPRVQAGLVILGAQCLIQPIARAVVLFHH
jgi:hypothetical protein